MNRGARAVGASSSVSAAGALDVAVFLCLLSLLSIRPMMFETFERAEWSFMPLGASGPTPAATAVLDFLLIVCSAVALSRHPPLSRRAQRFAVALACLLAAAIASSAVADQRRLAVNASSSLIIGIVACSALSRLCTARWMTSAIIAACLASGVVNAWKCVAQYSREFRETREYWNEYEKELIRRNVDVRAPEIVNYKRRLESGEAFGYLAHSNIAGECLASWLLGAAGLFGALGFAARGQTRRGIPAAGIAAAVATVAIGVGLALTHARGAMAAATVGLLGTIFIVVFRRKLVQRPVLILGTIAALYFGSIAAVGAWGLTRGTLPGSSLAFRWHYWTSAAQAWRDAPLTGIGGENFLSAFLRYKPVENPEDVRNPHNLWVWLLVEYGIVGLLSVATMFWLWGRSALERLASANSISLHEPHHARSVSAALVGPIIVVPIALAAFGRPELLFGESEASMFDRFYVWGVEVPLVWMASYLCLFWAAIRVTEAANAATSLRIDNASARRIADETERSDRATDSAESADYVALPPEVWLCAGLMCSVAIALVHNLVGFSLSTPAGVAVTGMLAAAALGPLSTHRDSSGGTGESPASNLGLHTVMERHSHALLSARLPLIALAIAVAGHLFLVVIPTWRTSSALGEMRRSLATARSPQQAGDAVLLAERAIAVDPWDSAPAREAARTSRLIASSAGIPPDDRIRWLRRAQGNSRISISRSPASVAGHRLSGAIQVDLGLALFEQSGQVAAEGVVTLRAAAGAWDTAAQLNPTHAGTRIEAGKAWFLVWQRTNDSGAGRKAAARLREALNLDEKRPQAEVVRLSAREKNDVQAHLAQLTAAGIDGP